MRLDPGELGAAPVVDQTDGHSLGHQVDLALRCALRIKGPTERPGIDGVVPDLHLLVPLLLVEVDEGGAVGVGLAVEAQVGGEEQGGGDRLGLEDDLVVTRRELDRVEPGARLGGRDRAARGAVDAGDAGGRGLGVAVGGVP